MPSPCIEVLVFRVDIVVCSLFDAVQVYCVAVFTTHDNLANYEIVGLFRDGWGPVGPFSPAAATDLTLISLY